ncbi:MAG: arabinofuranosyltransferase [Bacteroidia bacterium]
MLPLASYALGDVAQEMPSILMVVFALYITRNHLAFKPFEVAPACLFLPWALYFIIGVRQEATAEGPRYSLEALTRRDMIVGGLIGGFIFMTYYYYFFLFVLWIPIQFAVMRRTGRGWKEILAWVKGFAAVFGIAMAVSAVYWAPLLMDMARYGGQSFQNRWFQPNMFGLPLDISNQWRPLLGMMALLLLARRDALARVALAGAVAVLAFMILGHWGMYTGFPILHFRMVGIDEQLMHLGLVLGGMEVLRRYTGLLGSVWEKALPVSVIAIFCIGIGMVYTWEKGNEISQLAAHTETPVMVRIPDFDQVAKDKVFLTNRTELVAFKPMFLFLVPNAHYNHPAARYRERLKMLLLLSSTEDFRFLAWMLQHNRYDAVDRVLLDRNTLTAFDDNFPEGDNHLRVDVTFADSAFTAPYFPPDPYFGEIRQVQPQPAELWKEFTPGQRLLVALFTDVDPEAVRATLDPSTVKAVQDEIRIRTKDYPMWRRVFAARYLGEN